MNRLILHCSPLCHSFLATFPPEGESVQSILAPRARYSTQVLLSVFTPKALLAIGRRSSAANTAGKKANEPADPVGGRRSTLQRSERCLTHDIKTYSA